MSTGPGPGRDDADLDRLFDGPPDRFVAERDALAAGLRRAGDKDAATRVKRLRRPSAAAWALNQVARRQPDLVGRLVDAVADLRRAQAGAVRGEGADDLRAATTTHREAAASVHRAAAVALASEGSGARSAALDQVASTLRATTTAGAEHLDDLARGRLTVAFDAAGFGEVGEVDPAEPAPAPVTAAERESARRRAVEAARLRAAALSDEAERAEAEAERAESEAAGLSRRADEATTAARAARRRAHDARAAAEQASEEDG